MDIQYTLPLSRGWDRMKQALFRPFDLHKWMRLGFTAWLAGLVDCQGSSGGNGSSAGKTDWTEFFSFPETAWNWLQSHPLWFNLIILGVLFLFILISALIWVSSRGKFMFLHNVANDSAEISLPWHSFRKEGNSLFIWRFFFGWLGFLCIALFAVYAFVSAKGLYYGDYPGIVVFWKVAFLVIVFLAGIVVFGYVSLLLDHFVVPLQYKHRLTVMAGWSRFLRLFGSHFIAFLVYGLFIFILWVAAILAVLLFGIFTCCIGWLVLALPYIGAVLFLPVSYTFRALSLEFLAQFGSHFNVFPEADQVME